MKKYTYLNVLSCVLGLSMTAPSFASEFTSDPNNPQVPEILIAIRSQIEPHPIVEEYQLTLKPGEMHRIDIRSTLKDLKHVAENHPDEKIFFYIDAFLGRAANALGVRCEHDQLTRDTHTGDIYWEEYIISVKYDDQKRPQSLECVYAPQSKSAQKTS